VSHPHDFDELAHNRVLVCDHVWDHKHPILYVSHDGDGGWQFLCGGSHEDAEPVVVCLEHVVDRDPTLNELSGLGCNHVARRAAVGERWAIVDEGELKLSADVEKYGWHVVIVGDDDEGPGFAYSVGMTSTLDHPEIIVFGLPGELMQWMINEIGQRIRNGAPPPVGERVQGLLDEADCILHPVSEAGRAEFFGYACWYYDGADEFEALQCFWPGKIDGLFPWEPGVHESVKQQQPDLR
jgi:hypothetical protein